MRAGQLAVPAVADDHLAVVQALAVADHEVVAQADQANVDQQCHGAAAQDAPHHADVAMAGAVEHAVERAEQPAAEQPVEQP